MASGFRITLSVFFVPVFAVLFIAGASGQSTGQPNVNNAAMLPSQPTPADVQSPLSTYRTFRFGMSPRAVVKLSGMDPSEILTIHQRPIKIQGLDWTPGRFSREDAKPDPVEKIQFTFYDGKLSRTVVEYHDERTKGVTATDMIQALSAQYGTAALPAAAASFAAKPFSEGMNIVATWEDARYSINLVELPYGRKFGLVAFSKELDRLAENSVELGLRLDSQEAPQREKQQQQDALDRLAKAAIRNKSNFRP